MDDIAELRDQFPVVSQWFDSLATRPAFVAGVQKVGLSISSANSCCGSSGTTVLSDMVTKALQSFLGGKWQLQRSRPRPL